MRAILFAAVGLMLGYVAGAAIWYAGVHALSSNVHDLALEASMTAAFIGGPIGAVVGAIAGWMTARRR